MSANLGKGNSVDDEAKVVASIEHNGNLIEQVNCSTSTALRKHLLRCNREGRKVVPGRPVRLPENPAEPINYFLGLGGAEEIIEHSRPDQVISVQAGISMDSLQELLAQNKQWFPVCLPDENTSLMEYINGGSSGPLEQGYGEARDLVLGMQVVLGTGELVKCGGKVVKNVTGYDMPKLFAGAHGTLCIPFSAHLRLYALPEAASTLVFYFNSAAAAFQAARQLRRSGLPLSCLEIVDAEIFQFSDSDTSLFPVAFISKDKVFVCVQIHGTAAVVAELEKELSKIVGHAASAQEKLESLHEQQLWKFLSRPGNFLKAAGLELCGPSKVIEQLLVQAKDRQAAGSSRLEGNSRVAWTARPGRNKALLLVASTIQNELNSGSFRESSCSLAELISDLRHGSSSLSCRLTIAYADDKYLRQVCGLPEEDLVLNELKHRLKHQYDPRGILNPLTSL